jgi:predicted dehydrogenase
VAWECHRARFEHNADRMTVTACVDIIPERAEQAAANFGARAATDFEEVLPDVGVISALPHPVHHPVGMACLQAGKHVLMEKPLAINEAQCLDLIAAREKSGTVLMNGYSQRYNPLMLFLAELLFAKKYGECFTSRCGRSNTRGPVTPILSTHARHWAAGSCFHTGATTSIC